VWVTISGKTQIVTDWIKELNIPMSTYNDRVRAQNKTPIEALTMKKYGR
jgi:hypothetical protein